MRPGRCRWSAVAGGAVVALHLLFSGCGGTGGTTVTGGGTTTGGAGTSSPATPQALVDSTLVRSYSAAEVTSLASSQGLTGIPAATRGVSCYKLRYHTADGAGAAVTASGMMVVPQGNAGPLALLSYQHGTQVQRTEVPSNPSNSELATVIGAFASGDYLIVAADYLGLGDAPGLHPYLVTPLTVSACVDLLHAAREAAAAMGLSLNGQTFLTGYSQGGHATMALHRELQANYAAEYPVRAAAPISGPYDLSGTQLSAIIETNSLGSPVFVSDLLVAYDRQYDIYNSTADAFASPYDQRVVGLYDGSNSYLTIVLSLPLTPGALLTASFIDAVRTNAQHPLNVALRRNDCYDWRPSAPVRLYHGRADHFVFYQNATVAQARMSALGGDVQVVNLGDLVDHLGSLAPGLSAARQWFASLPASRGWPSLRWGW